MLSRLSHFFLPRESNNHRAKALHHQSLLGLIAILLLGQFVFSFVSHHTTGVLGAASDISLADLLTQTNKVREEHGLSQLTLDSRLVSAANAKGQDMFTHNYWAHNSPEGLTPWVFIKGASYDYLYAGENLARGFDNATSVMNAWMASPGHRENILSPNYKDVGFAVLSGSLTGEDTTLVVEEFGSLNTASSETTSIALPTPTSTPRTIQVAGTNVSPSLSPTIGVLLTPTPGIPIGVIPSPIMTEGKAVAAAGIVPLANTKSLKEPIAIGILLILIAILVVDIIIIERKKIVRLFSHNLDHIIYLVILLIIILIMGRGMTL